MTTLKRSYTPQTLKVLFALSGNQCAHPDCTNPVIEPATEQSDAHVAAQICHIYAISPNGPRGKSGLTQKELNSPENLILLCRHHHGIVDGQHETYSVTQLKQWKQSHEAEMQERLSTDLAAIQADVLSHPYFPVALVDQKIAEEVENLRKSRFFQEFDRIKSSLALGERLSKRELSGGSDKIRGQGLAWCARLLSYSNALDKTKEFLEIARTLGDSPEIQIAEAFVLSQKGDKAAALQTLAAIDSGASRSAALVIVAHHDGAKGAVQWMHDARYQAGDLDADGKNLFLNYQLQLGHWDAAARTVSFFSKSDFEEAPILHHSAALAKLSIAVPADFRAVTLKQTPFDAANTPLASDAIAMDARRTAYRHFLNGVEAAKQLGCLHAARIDDEYALWLELRDPAQSAHGKSRLVGKLRNPSIGLGFVRYALQFGIKMDLNAVERDTERNIAINGEMTIDAAAACFALAFTKATPEESANYIARYHDQLAAHIPSNLMRSLQIEMLSRAGLIERANAILSQLIEQGIPVEQENNLKRLISESLRNEPVKSRKEQYMSTGDLTDLINLVTALEEHRQWFDLCKFGKRLFEETHALRDAERLVDAFNSTQRSEAVVDFLNANPGLLAQSRHLKMSYAWGLYNEGALLESRAALAELSDDAASPNYRVLQMNLGIAMGDWASLSNYIANEYQNRHDRSACDLVDAAQLAFHIASPHAKELVFEAAEKADGDATILARAYFVATSAGWENDPDVFQWLEQAAELSGENGPIQKMNLKDILDRKPEWDRRESDIWRLLAQGRIPIFMAAQSLNKTLINLTTFPALVNLSETDPRRRSAIPAYSGGLIPQPFDLTGKKVALDATALLTLSFLNILDVALDAFETVYIPHSTLGWLFEEWQKATFHQPSRMRNARKVRDLLSTKVLEKFDSSTVASSDLALQVGDELAALIAEAERIREGDDTQHIVVRSSPVYRLSSLLEEEADLSAHAAALSSCLAVVAKLRQKGQITANEEKRACAYLQFHEKPWPNQPEISDGATLYLDGLSITYLLHLELLGKLKAAGLRAVASPGEVSEADALIAYKHISDGVKDVIESVRVSLNSRIESGKVRVGSRQKIDADEDEDKSILEYPTAGVMDLASYCDAAIVDDRFINQHPNIDSGGTQMPVLSTLGLLDALVSGAVISDDDRLEYRTRLRRAGYFFVPVSEKELERCLRASDVVDGNVLETAELKAIRESMLRVRMSDWLQLPEETLWLASTIEVFIRVLKSLWVEGEDHSIITARSDWILNQIDVRGWAHSFGSERGDNIVRLGRGAHILRLALPINASKKVNNAYLEWVEDRILTPIRENFPDLYSWIVKQYRKLVVEIAENRLIQEETT